MEFNIKEINKENSKDTIKLLNKVFYNQSLADKIVIYFVIKYKDSTLTKILLNIFSYKSIELWGAFRKESNELLGIVGAYNFKNDMDSYFWLGWFCTINKFRRNGIGKVLLNFIEKKAKNRGKKAIKLYTCDIPDRQVALKLYDKRNYKITSTENTNKHKIIYRQLDI